MENAERRSDKNWIYRTIVFLTSQTLSLFGSSVVGYIIIWYITLETSSGAMMTISILCTFLPRILISLFAGIIADRVSRKLIIMLSDFFIAVATLILALVFLSGYTELWLLFVASVIRSVGSGFQSPAVNAALPQIVPQGKLTKVNGINTSLISIMELAAPALGGVLLSTVGFVGGLFFDVGTALLAIGIMAFLKLAPPERLSSGQSVFRDMADGLRYMTTHRLFRALGIFYAIIMFFVSPSAFLTPIMIARSYGPEIWRLTANEMSWSAGALAAGLLIGLWPGFKRKLRTVAVSAVGFAVCFLMLGLVREFWIYLTVMGLAAVFVTYFSTTQIVIFQSNIEESMMGRFFSLMQIISSVVIPAGMLIFGPMGDVMKIEVVLVASGIIMLVASGIFVIRMESKLYSEYHNL